MIIRWMGHATFIIEGQDGKKVLNDPYADNMGYKSIDEKVDLVTISHKHYDHNNTAMLPKGFESLSNLDGTVVTDIGVKVTGIKSWHDNMRGVMRGSNIIYVIEMDGLRIAHMGDLGHQLSDEQLAAMGKIDIAMIPIGGTFTLNAKGAVKLIEALKPRVTIPMHYKTSVLKFPISTEKPFLKAYSGEVKHFGKSLEVDSECLNQLPGVVLLDYIG